MPSRGFEPATARCLQFPDELLELSAGVAAALSAACQRRSPEAHEVQLFVMADTSYGSCCVDEIAAAHVDAQCVVHYGHACLTPTSRLPAKFVFGKASLDISDCAAKLRQLADNSQKPLVVCSRRNSVLLRGPAFLTILHAPELSHAIAALQAAVMQCSSSERDVARPHLIFAKVRCTEMEPSPAAPSKRIEMGAGPTSQGDSPLHKESEDAREGRHMEPPSGDDLKNEGGDAPVSSSERASGPQGEPENGPQVRLGGLEWCLPPGASEQDVVLAWIGPEGPALTHIMLVHHRCQFVQYDPATKALHTDFVKHSKLLSRRQVSAIHVLRYYLVERAKEAGIVGIILGTLAIAGYQAVLERLRKILKSAGKKHYTFLMGKLNPAKLANFPEVCIHFCRYVDILFATLDSVTYKHVPTNETALLDNRDYLAPIITPFEAEIAFMRGRTWTGAYRLDMDIEAESTRSATDSRAGRDPGDSAGDQPQVEEEQQDSDEPRFSFISGGYVNDNSEHDGGTGTTSMDLALALSTERALQLRQGDGTLTTGAAAQAAPVRSGAEYLALRRMYQGLEIPLEGDPETLELSPQLQRPGAPHIPPSSILQGRTGRAAKYVGEDQ
eukprot:SM000118S25586  [mRNA]  locus=s118:144641:148574:- [translate_table: standard]